MPPYTGTGRITAEQMAQWPSQWSGVILANSLNGLSQESVAGIPSGTANYQYGIDQCIVMNWETNPDGTVYAVPQELPPYPQDIEEILRGRLRREEEVMRVDKKPKPKGKRIEFKF